MALLSLKAAYFFFSVSLSLSIPVLHSYLISVGLNIQQLRIIFWPRILSQFMGRILFGFIVDKTGNYSLIFSIQIVSTTLLLLPVPWMPKLASLKDIQVQYQENGKSSAILVNSCSRISKISETWYRGILSKSLCCEHPVSPKANTSNGIFLWNKSEDDILDGRLHGSQCSWFSAFSGCRKCKVPYDVRDPNSVLVVNISSQFPCKCQEMFLRSTFSLSILHKFDQKKAALSKVSNKENNKVMEEDGEGRFLLIITIFLSCAGFFDGSIPALIDSLVLVKGRHERTEIDYGQQKVWGAIGGGISSICMSLYFSRDDHPDKVNFTLVFALYLISNFLFYLVSFHMVKRMRLPRDFNRCENTSRIAMTIDSLKRFHVIFYFFTILLVGVANGAKNNVTLKLIKNLSGANTLYRILALISAAFDVAMFPFARRIIKIVGGNYTAIMLSLVANSVRYLIYSYLKNAKDLIFLEPLHCIGFSLFWVAAVYEIDNLTQTGQLATMMSFLYGIYFGLAVVLADYFFEIAFDMYGLVISIRAFSFTLVAWTLIMFIYRSMYMRCRNSSYSTIEGRNQSACMTDALLMDTRSSEVGENSQKNNREVSETWI